MPYKNYFYFAFVVLENTLFLQVQNYANGNEVDFKSTS